MIRMRRRRRTKSMQHEYGHNNRSFAPYRALDIIVLYVVVRIVHLSYHRRTIPASPVLRFDRIVKIIVLPLFMCTKCDKLDVLMDNAMRSHTSMAHIMYIYAQSSIDRAMNGCREERA